MSRIRLKGMRVMTDHQLILFEQAIRRSRRKSMAKLKKMSLTVDFLLTLLDHIDAQTEVINVARNEAGALVQDGQLTKFYHTLAEYDRQRAL